MEFKSAEDLEIDRQIDLASKNLSSEKNLRNIIHATLDRLDYNQEKAADSLVFQKIFRQSPNGPDPLVVALEAIKRNLI